MQRPVGVTVLAVLNFIGACFLVLGGLLAIVGAGFLGASAAAGKPMGPMALLAGGGIIIGVFFIIFAVIPVVIGYGLLKLKNWARIVSIVFAVIGIVGSLPGLFSALGHVVIFTLVVNLIGIGIDALIVWYLLQPDVKKAFAAA